MDFDCPHLFLAPHWADEDDRRRIVLVRNVDAIRLSGSSEFKTVPAWETTRELRRRSRSLDRELSDFLARTTLDLPGSRRRRPQELVSEAVAYIKCGAYVGVRRIAAARWDDDDASAADLYLAREIERGSSGRLWTEGRRYKLVAGIRVDDIADRNSYEVVPHGEAVRVVDKLAAQFTGSGALATRLREARARLAADWRPPMRPKGLVLLRKVVVPRSASTPLGPAITPSQMQAMMAPAQTYQFVWDQPFSQRQWVNLPSAWGVVAFGQVATLSGHVEPRVPGQVVSFTLFPDPGNPADAAATLEAMTATSDAEGKVQVGLSFPIHPGAKFKVSGKTLTMAAAVESEPITVWRRLYYQITVMDPAPDKREFKPPADMISALEPAFNPVWIDFAPGTKATATTPYKAHLTFAERWSLECSLKGSAQDDRSPFKMNIVAIDTADIVAELTWAAYCVNDNVETPAFTKWPHDPTVIYACYGSAGSPGRPLTNVQVVDLEGGRAKVTATIPPTAQPTAVLVNIRYRYQRGFAGGWGGATGTVYVCLGRLREFQIERMTGSQIQRTLTHEIGHALGLVPVTAAWADPNPDDAVYGLRHCGTKSSNAKFSCVMWSGFGSGSDGNRFCTDNDPNNCTHFLLHADLSAIQWI